MESSGEAWAACRVMTKPQLLKIARRPGFHMMEETARTELRKRASSVLIAGGNPHTVFHNLDKCKCATCNALRRPGSGGGQPAAAA